MAFINEVISESDKRKIDWSQFKAWEFSRPHDPPRRTVDSERNVFFVRLSGRGREGDYPEVYALYWQEEVIRIEADVTQNGNPKTGSDVHWNILNIHLPGNLENLRSQILKVRQEAIEVHGALYRINPVNSVYIQFDAMTPRHCVQVHSMTNHEALGRTALLVSQN